MSIFRVWFEFFFFGRGELFEMERGELFEMERGACRMRKCIENDTFQSNDQCQRGYFKDVD